MRARRDLMCWAAVCLPPGDVCGRTCGVETERTQRPHTTCCGMHLIKTDTGTGGVGEGGGVVVHIVAAIEERYLASPIV